MKVLVTGGAGFIGSHLVDRLLARKDRVLVIDNYATGRRDNLTAHPSLTIVEGTIADRGLVERAFAEFGPEQVVHAAASYKDPDNWTEDSLTNVVGTANVVQASKAARVRRLIYFQTALCYGLNPIQQPIRLDHPKRPANSSYAISKTAAEDYLELSGLDYVTFRLANVIGPRNVSGPLPIFYERLTSGKRCFVTPARRDFVYVGDLARAVAAAVMGRGNGTYHFSTGTDVAIKELYDAVVKALALNTYPEPELRPLGPGDASSILLDPSRTFEDFGEIEFTPLAETVARAMAYYREWGVHGGYTHLPHASAAPSSARA